MDAPTWLSILVLAIGGVIVALCAVWFALAMASWLLEAREEAPLVFLILLIATFPWGPLTAIGLEMWRRRRQTPDVPGTART